MNKKLTVIGPNGTVIRQIDGYDVASFNPTSFADGETPIISDSDLPPVIVTKGFLIPGGEGSTGSQSVGISPVTEQLLTGTIAGSFSLNEQVFQSQFIPEIVNSLVLSGVTATEYNPTVQTIGVSGPELGNRSAKFYGSYLGLDTKAAGIKVPPFTTTGITHFMFSGFVYFESTPSIYDPIILTRTADGVNSSTNDSFRLEYDVSGNQLQFHFATANTSSAGMPYVLNVCPTNGVTLNQWHQFAIAYTNQGGSACASSYWNGNRYAQYTGISGSIKNSTAPLMLGSGASGDKPLKGYLEHIMVSMGGSTLALREFDHGATAPVDATIQYAGDYTVYAMTMNGPLGSSLFPCANARRVISSATFVDPYTSTVGVSNISREETSVHGSTLFTGVNGGHTASNRGASSGYLFGYSSGACMIVSSVTPTFTALSDGKKIKGTLIDHTIAYLFGSTAMRGTCASPADFPKLFGGSAGSFSGSTFSFLPIAGNVNLLRSIYDDIIISGRTGTYSLSDFEGNMYTFSTGGVKNLYSDVVSYQSIAFTEGTSVKNAVSSAATVTALMQINGFSGEGLIRKLAPSLDKNSYLYVAGKGKATKLTYTPELAGDIGPGDIEGIGEK